ncbi:hypothetical protein PIB30_061336 [Stylosanthes scabra]|uniref:Uncharacterized protein n=1 Tax=Stylosanthes scabra TaxID=79078 RepID=A0ABU6YJN8_9FABA|nr:hypothetical protein [Stylosanthes scabra]
MDSFGEDCLPPSLTSLEIYGCEKLERLITSKGLQAQGLTDLIISYWHEVKSFPREGCLSSSLRSLTLWRFSNLEMLDCHGLHHLTFLKELDCSLSWKLERMNDPRIRFARFHMIQTLKFDMDFFARIAESMTGTALHSSFMVNHH